MEHRRGALHDRLNGGEVGDVAGDNLDPRIVEARTARLADIEQQQLAHFLRLAVSVGQAALLQDSPRQLLAEEARAAGDHHLHVRFHPDFVQPEVCTERSLQSMLGSDACDQLEFVTARRGRRGRRGGTARA
jgi:hypothetical protein